MTQSAMIVLAGGSGSRFQAEKPKQLAMLAGKTILEHLLVNVASCDALKQIIVVGRRSILPEIAAIAEAVSPDKITVVAGGDSRLASTQAGLAAVHGPDATKVLIHDAVRPFLKHSIIRKCLSDLDIYEAVDVVIPSTDTLVQVDPEKPDMIQHIPPRIAFRRGQTPQGFWLGKLRAVIQETTDLEKAQFTDDCGMYLFARPHAEIGLVEGDETNIKITHPIDLFIAEQLIMSGSTTDAPALAAVDISDLKIVIFGASSGLGADASKMLTDLGVEVFGASRQTDVDVTQPDQVANFLAQTEVTAGRIDAVVNFAGILHIGALAQMSQSEVAAVVQTNYQGSLNVARLAHKYLRRSQGQLVLVSSSSYYRGRADFATYSSSKAAVVNMTQALSEEWAEDDIRVNCIVPRRASTPMRWVAFPQEDRRTLLQPVEISRALLLLLKSAGTGLINHVY